MDSSKIQSVLKAWEKNNGSASGAPQQLANGLYRCAELTYLIANKADTLGVWNDYLSDTINRMYTVNESLQGAPQQSANGMYRIVELLGGWAQAL